MIYLKSVKKFCKDDISMIENDDKAIADKTQTWQCHHRRETIFSRKDLIEIGEYYNRPACELIFLTKSEHMRLHKIGENNQNFGKLAWNNGKHLSEETRQKLSEANKGNPSWMKGKHHSEESRKKIGAARKGKHRSEETRLKISSALKGKSLSAETCQKLSEALKGKHHSAETRKKISEALKGKPTCIKGKHWYNNGVKNILAKTCPEGFVPGRIVCNKRS